MSRNELRFARDDVHEPKTIHFEASDASMALILAHRQAPDWPAELLRDDNKVCSIKRKLVNHSEIWIIAG